MKNPVAVDTDVFSYAFKEDTRSQPYAAILAGRTSCVSFMTVAELYAWAILRNWGAARQQTLKYSIERCVILPYDDATAQAWASITAQRQRAGKPIGCGDCWIAASARRFDLELVTNNPADYAGIDGLRIRKLP